MMSPVAYDHLSVPSRATLYSLPSCDPTSTDPSAAMAGDDTFGALVMNVHQMAGFVAGSTKGERPRCVGPKRNIAWAGSIAYCGKGTDGPPSPPACTEGRAVSPGHTQRPASQRRLSLQSLSDAQGAGSTCAQLRHATRAATTAVTRRQVRRRPATSVTVTRRPACSGPVKAEPGTRGARTAREPSETRPATDMEFGWRKVKANWKSCKIV